MRRFRCWFIVCGVCFLGLASASSLQANCQRLYEQGDRAVERNDLVQLQTLYDQASHDCDETFRRKLGKRFASAHYNAGRIAWQQGNTERAISVLKKARVYDNLWQTSATLGEIHHQNKAYGKAAADYQHALDLIQEEKAPPPMEVIKGIYRKAEESRLLAPEHVPMPRHRDTGALAGVGARTFRGFTPEARITPITFYFDSTQFDDKGQQAAAELARLLQEQQPPAITLTGHADPIGSDAYNLDLSHRRAEALKAYLAQTYRGRIRTDGKGEREPYEPAEPQQYTQEELYRLHRRVELRFTKE